MGVSGRRGTSNVGRRLAAHRRGAAIAGTSIAIVAVIATVAIARLNRSHAPEPHLSLDGQPSSARSTPGQPSSSQAASATLPSSLTPTGSTIPSTTRAHPTGRTGRLSPQPSPGTSPGSGTTASRPRTTTRTTTTNPPPPRTYEEMGGNRSGSLTFEDTKGLAQGPNTIAFGQAVQVSCKVYDVTMPSADPDGYWYRIASSPWNNRYYAVANTFTNGDPLGSPGSTHTDFRVPDC